MALEEVVFAFGTISILKGFFTRCATLLAKPLIYRGVEVSPVQIGRDFHPTKLSDQVADRVYLELSSSVIR